jgi:glutaredoxin 2
LPPFDETDEEQLMREMEEVVSDLQHKGKQYYDALNNHTIAILKNSKEIHALRLEIRKLKKEFVVEAIKTIAESKDPVKHIADADRRNDYLRRDKETCAINEWARHETEQSNELWQSAFRDMDLEEREETMSEKEEWEDRKWGKFPGEK